MTDLDYQFGRNQDVSDDRDNRSDYRLTARARAVLELEAVMPEEGDGEGDGRQLTCNIRDISASGLCLSVSEPVSIGALLPVTVTLSSVGEPFRLTVEVIWCRPNDGAFLVGLHIVESDETAYVEWVDAVARAMAEE